MNLAVMIGIAGALGGTILAAFALGMSRSPAWPDLRLFALVAATAAAYCGFDLALVMDVPAAVAEPMVADLARVRRASRRGVDPISGSRRSTPAPHIGAMAHPVRRGPRASRAGSRRPDRSPDDSRPQRATWDHVSHPATDVPSESSRLSISDSRCSSLRSVRCDDGGKGGTRDFR